MTRSYLLLLTLFAISMAPTVAGKNVRRRLQDAKISREEAEKACAKHGAGDREACIFDVMATGDLDMAESF